ncbi:MAG: DUF4339 domain-containing protein [Pseudomonadota bacterium]
MANGHQMAGAFGASQGGAGGTSPWGAAPRQPAAAPPPPPPPPQETVWHVAENGATHGPYSRADLGRMMGEGRFSRDTMVWSAGMSGWTKAGEVPPLAQLFTIAPPPPPPPPA